MFIANITINRSLRENPQTGRRILNLDIGEYVIRQAEGDGQVTIYRRRDVLSLMITEPARTTTSESTQG